MTNSSRFKKPTPNQTHQDSFMTKKKLTCPAANSRAEVKSSAGGRRRGRVAITNSKREVGRYGGLNTAVPKKGGVTNEGKNEGEPPSRVNRTAAGRGGEGW